MKTRFEFIIKADNEVFNIKTNKPMFVLTSFQHFLDSDLDKLSLQQLEFEMDPAGYPDKYNCFIGILWSPSVPLLEYFS